MEKDMKTVQINGIEYPVYATIEDANNYFNASFGNNWNEVSDEDKAKLLVSATRSIDRDEWKGVKKEENQPLAFPRLLNDKETDAELLLRACCEEAIAIYNNGKTSQYNTEGIQSMRVQDTEITFKSGAEEQHYFSNAVEDILKEYRYYGIRVLY